MDDRFVDRDMVMRYRGGGIGHKSTRRATDFFKNDRHPLGIEHPNGSDNDDDDDDDNAERNNIEDASLDPSMRTRVMKGRELIFLSEDILDRFGLGSGSQDQT